jgi:hypothetical protein
MACIPAIPATCVVDGVTDAVTGVVGNAFADAMREGAEWVIKTTVGWWINVPAVDLTRSPADTNRGYVLWLAIVVAVAGVIWQGVQMAISRKPDPLLNVGRGLFLVALWSAVGIIGPALALRAGDAFASWVLSEAAGGRAADRLVDLASLAPIESAGAVIILGLLMMVAGLVQAILMMFREGALVILAGVTVLAAAGSFSTATRPWLPRVIGWMLALIAYKPVAAMVYASALALVGDSSDPRTLLVGLSMMILAIVALPALMKFFTWTTGSLSSSGGSATAALAGAAAATIHARAMMAAPPSSPASQATHIRSDLGPVAGPSVAAGAATAAAPSAATAAAGASGAGASAAGPVGLAVVGATQAAATAGRAATRSMTKDDTT